MADRLDITMTPSLQLTNISKSFAATQALRSVSLEVVAGEVHAIVGENGAGKSTLINIISGSLQPDEGFVAVDGFPVALSSARSALTQGIATVHQELSVVEHLSVAENIFAACAPTRFGLIDWARMKLAAEDILEQLNVRLDVSTRVANLPVSSRQLVEIAKALASKPRILLLDEPTSALNAAEKEALFGVVRRLRANGIALIYISHHLDEVRKVSDRVTVLRDGENRGTWQTQNTTPEFLVAQMVGCEVPTSAKLTEEIFRQEPVLQVQGLSLHPIFRDISFTLHKGEIIGLAGLMGSGRSALASCLSGLAQADEGAILRCGHLRSYRSLRDAMTDGVAYVPGERKTAGLFLSLSVADNTVAAILPRLTKNGRFDTRRCLNMVRQLISTLRIKTSGPLQACASLSGGNQQKVLMAKWMVRGPQLLIIEEPTRGVDVAAKHDIHVSLRDLARQGTSIIFVSSDLPELLSLSDRILVMHGGSIVADLDTLKSNEQEVAALASGIRNVAA